jgi:DNA-binding transcriptional ArsR family regulator
MKAKTSTFAALADPTRLRIVELLAKSGELSAGEISHKFTSTPSAISQHLKVLRDTHLVTMKKRAQQRIYELDVNTMTGLEVWLGATTRQWNARLDAMDEYLQTLKKENA